MRVNPVLRKLGLSATDRVLIAHADDLAVGQTTLAAFADLIDFGLLSSGSAIVPSAWFPAMADYCREHPDADVGVHPAITCEWQTYRWGPISTRDPSSGLMDDDGYFHRRGADAQRYADPRAVQVEIGAQIDRAIAAGIKPSHVDSHMWALIHPKFYFGYVEQVVRRRLIPFLRSDLAYYKSKGFGDEEAAAAIKMAFELEEQGFPLFDNDLSMPLREAEGQIEEAKRLVDSLEPGLTLLVLHPVKDTPEARAILRYCPARVADYETFMSSELRDYVRNAGVHVISYRPLLELLPSDL